MRTLLLLACLVLAQAAAAQVTVANQIEAVVNDKVVTQFDVMKALRKKKIPYDELPESEKEREYEKMLANLVLDILHRRAVDKADMQISEEELINFRTQRIEEFGTRAAFQEFLQTQGLTEDEFNRQFRRDQEAAAWLKVVSGSGAGGVKRLNRELRPRYNTAVTPREIREYYAEHKEDEFTLKEEADIRVIQVYFSRGDRAEKRRQKQRLLGLLQKLETKADFGVLAKKTSAHPSAEKGGEIGRVERGKDDLIPQPIEEAVFAEGVEDGDVLGPIEHFNSWWLVQVRERQEARVVPFSEAQRRIQAILRREKEGRAIRIIQLELVQEAHITPSRLKRRIIAMLGG